MRQRLVLSSRETERVRERGRARRPPRTPRPDFSYILGFASFGELRKGRDGMQEYAVHAARGRVRSISGTARCISDSMSPSPIKDQLNNPINVHVFSSFSASKGGSEAYVRRAASLIVPAGGTSSTDPIRYLVQESGPHQRPGIDRVSGFFSSIPCDFHAFYFHKLQQEWSTRTISMHGNKHIYILFF